MSYYWICFGVNLSGALQVLSHNLCTVMKIPHDPVALEEHFRDDDEGPVSNQGYMPYLNRFILDKVSAFFIVQSFEDCGPSLSGKMTLRQTCLDFPHVDLFRFFFSLSFSEDEIYVDCTDKCF